MAVAYDNSVQAIDFSVTTLTTGSFTIGAGADRVAMICLSSVGNPGAITNMIVGGVTGSAVASATGDDGTWWHVVYKVLDPPSGSQTGSATWANSTTALVSVITATGADDVNNGNYAETAGSAVGVAITSTSGDLTASFSGNDLTDTSASSNQTQRLSGTEIGADTGPGSGTTTHTWTHTGSFNCNVAGANFTAAGGAAATILRQMLQHHGG